MSIAANDAFRRWVANTVWRLSGIWPTDWCASDKWVITTAKNGVVACQGVCEEFFDNDDHATTRVAGEVVTNHRRLH